MDEQQTTETDGSPSLFAVEKATYEVHREQLVAEHDGEYVLIKGDEIIGTGDLEELHKKGCQQFGYELFLLRPIEAVDRQHIIPSNWVAK